MSEPFDLMDDEEILLETRPHPLAMVDLMMFWLAIGALGVIFLIYYPQINGLVDGVKIKFVRDFLGKHAYNALWTAALVAPMVIMAVFRINFGYVLTLVAIVAANFLFQWKVEPRLGFHGHSHFENLLLMGVAVVGVVGVELFRRGHRYYLTSSRIIARFGSIRVSERSTLYSKIDDLILQQTLLGKLFNFGTVIPLTSTGLGMGQDLAIAGAGVGGGKAGVGAQVFAAGAKGQNVPRELSFYVLFRVKDPALARDIVMEQMQARDRPAAR